MNFSPLTACTALGFSPSAGKALAPLYNVGGWGMSTQV
jgi:hypothetical protein